MHSLLKSAHFGFDVSMSATFLSRRHPLICFSRAIAARTSEVVSKYTRRSIRYFRSESGNEGIPVLEHPAGEIVRDACVKGLRTVRGYVDEVLVLPSHYRWSISPPEGTGADPSLRSG